MNRRESLKSLLVGGVGTGLLISCRLDDDPDLSKMTNIREKEFDYGRTPEEAEYDEELMSKKFYTDEEMATILLIADIIIPGDGDHPPASKTGLAEFIEFITKDLPEHKIPMRGGLRWLENESNQRFEKGFKMLSEDEQIAIIDDIAYPAEVKPQHVHGAKFFSRLRNLVTTGYFTSKEGIEYLGYQGNRPNVWDGVPPEVLEKHGLAYDEKMLKNSIKPEERNEIEEWKNYEI
ncbi:gluconate 2-dehydrogenase subunit 3 family protein [uncultured Christiangramia sp.]|uniref:gluconate 2-dehydrogenase subunit 3 family protein n=1 Tax=Christiangramia sp. 3-2217-3z TaxID=3417564 RepID=UPI00260F90FB|nr:gluconate 2-dehydrogenase subunit 3 family protein [uncultured Christiangramia sp.]